MTEEEFKIKHVEDTLDGQGECPCSTQGEYGPHSEFSRIVLEYNKKSYSSIIYPCSNHLEFYLRKKNQKKQWKIIFDGRDKCQSKGLILSQDSHTEMKEKELQ